MKVKARWFKIFLNRYVLCLTVFAVWMVFFDQNNMIRQVQARRDLNKLRGEKHFFEEKIKEYNFELQALDKEPAYIEKYARENYYMSKPNEDVFVVLADTTN